LSRDMTFSIFDNGNLLASFDSADDAYEFGRIVAENAAADDGLLLVAFDEDGRVVDDWAPSGRVAHAV
jgi:hypothetical protein